MKKINYRKLYGNIHGKICEGWQIHHIDWNRENNDIDNLIALPKQIHQLVHKYLGYVSREEFQKLLEVYKTIRVKATLNYINYKLRKYVNTNKCDELSKQCRASMHANIIQYRSSFDWIDGKGGMN